MNLITETGRRGFYQWDTNQILIVQDAPNCRQVHFGYRDGTDAMVCGIREVDGIRVVDVPNILLQKDKVFFAYLMDAAEDGAVTSYPNSFEVTKRPKPEDYVYTETEVLTYSALAERVAALEENGGSGGGTVKTVNGVAPDDNGNVTVAIPEAVTDAHINSLIDAKLGVIENGAY